VHGEHLDRIAQEFLYTMCCWFRCTLQPWRGVFANIPCLSWDTSTTSSPPLGSRDWPTKGGSKFLQTLATQQEKIALCCFLSY